MNVLPEQIVVLDGTLGRTRLLRRVDLGDRYTEAELDALIAREVDMIASVLIEGGFLDDDCGLRLLAQQHQVANIDGLFAVVADGELVRLVIVESKLFKNPEQNRKVLAQIMDYANHLQFDVTSDEVIARAEGDTKLWLQERRHELAALMAKGDFLLLICGDRIQPRLLELAKPFLDRRDHVLSRVELGLLSLAMYEDDVTRVLVPNLVGAVTRDQRDFCIEVRVKTEAGDVVPATVSVVEGDDSSGRALPARSSRKKWTEDGFFDQAKDWASSDGYQDPSPGLRALLTFAEKTAGFSVRWGGGKTGTFTILAEFPELPDSGTNVCSVYAGSDVYVERKSIAARIGHARATERTANLGKMLGVPVIADGAYVHLGDAESVFDVNDEKGMRIFQGWLIETRDEILAALRA